MIKSRVETCLVRDYRRCYGSTDSDVRVSWYVYIAKKATRFVHMSPEIWTSICVGVAIIATILGQLRFMSNSLNSRFDEVDKRFDSIDNRFDSVDKRFEAEDSRFESMDSRFESIDRKIDEQAKRFEERSERIESQITNLKDALVEQTADLHTAISNCERQISELKGGVQTLLDVVTKKIAT